jgi:hypothetical protein
MLKYMTVIRMSYKIMVLMLTLHQGEEGVGTEERQMEALTFTCLLDKCVKEEVVCQAVRRYYLR